MRDAIGRRCLFNGAPRAKMQASSWMPQDDGLFERDIMGAPRERVYRASLAPLRFLILMPCQSLRPRLIGAIYWMIFTRRRDALVIRHGQRAQRYRAALLYLRLIF